jgi:hypothetical protein
VDGSNISGNWAARGPDSPDVSGKEYFLPKCKTTILIQSLSVMADGDGDVTNNSDDLNVDDFFFSRRSAIFHTDLAE